MSTLGVSDVKDISRPGGYLFQPGDTNIPSTDWWYIFAIQTQQVRNYFLIAVSPDLHARPYFGVRDLTETVDRILWQQI